VSKTEHYSEKLDNNQTKCTSKSTSNLFNLNAKLLQIEEICS